MAGPFTSRLYQWNVEKPDGPQNKIQQGRRWRAHLSAQGVAISQAGSCDRSWCRSSATALNVRPEPSRIAFFPESSSHLLMITSQYLGSISIKAARRPVRSQAIKVDPEPANRSRAPLFRFSRVARMNSKPDRLRKEWLGLEPVKSRC